MSADGVAKNVTDHGEEMLIALHGKTFETALPDVTAASVVPVVSPHVCGQPPLHELAEDRARFTLDDGVEVIREQAECK